MRLHLASAILSLAAGTLALTACSPSAPSAQSKTTVVAAFYPLQYAAEQIGGTGVNVTNLTQPGVEPHDLELSAAQVADIANADLVLYIRGFQPAVDEAVDQQAADHAIDVAQGLSRLDGPEGSDPHVWLDPANMSQIGAVTAARLAAIDPDKAKVFSQNASALSASMTALSADFAKALAHCPTTTIVVSHQAFGYLAHALGFTQVGISGLNPEAEPSPARMREVADVIRRNGVTTIYYESLVDPKVAQTIAEETGAKPVMLDPLEGLRPGSKGDYVSVMLDNLKTLKTGQMCS
ncbi:MAG: metal ABC transporter substrate-binding protein [Candidatus Nanopelagicales bacterium]